MIQSFSNFMANFFPVLLCMSLTAGITVLLVLAVRALLQKMNAPRIFSYALWGIVLFRLLCPVSFSAPFSVLALVPGLSQEGKTLSLPHLPLIGNLSSNALQGAKNPFSGSLAGTGNPSSDSLTGTRLPSANDSNTTDFVLSRPIPTGTVEITKPSEANSAETKLPQGTLSPSEDGKTGWNIYTETIHTTDAAQDNQAAEPNKAGTDKTSDNKTTGSTVIRTISAMTGILTTLLWLAGIVTILAINLRNYLLLKKKAACSMKLSDNIYLADGIGTPCCLGLVSPKIYLPSALSEKEREYVILHEKHHIERRDYIIKPVAFLALCLHWFNPLVWVAFVLAGRDMEMSCDEAVLKKIKEDIRADYATSLLQLAAGRKVLSVSCLSFGGNNPKQRIKNIMNYKKRGKFSTILACILCIAVAGCAVSNPGTGREPEMTTDGKPLSNNADKVNASPVAGTDTGESSDYLLAGTDNTYYEAYSPDAYGLGNVALPTPVPGEPEDWKKNIADIFLDDESDYFLYENGYVIEKKSNQPIGTVLHRGNYETVLHLSGAVKEHFEALFDDSGIVTAQRLNLGDVDQNGQTEYAWCLSFGGGGLTGPFVHLALEFNGEIIFLHDEPTQTAVSVKDAFCLDIDHDGEQEIYLTMLPYVNSRPLTEFAVLKKCNDGTWKALENPADCHLAAGNVFTNAFPISVRKSDQPFVAEISCKGLEKTICYDTQNYCNRWMDSYHGWGCTCGCQNQNQSHHGEEHHGNGHHGGSTTNTSGSAEKLTLEGKIATYYRNEFPKLAKGESCGGTCNWGIWSMRTDTCNGVPCLVATHGIEGKEQVQCWGTADVYFDYDSNGCLHILDMMFYEYN